MPPSLPKPSKNPSSSPSRHSGDTPEPEPPSESFEITTAVVLLHSDASSEPKKPTEPHTPSRSSCTRPGTLSVHSDARIESSDSLLTVDNLDLLSERSTSPTMPSVEELRRRLRQAKIYMDDKSALIPRALQDHVTKLKVPRVAPSPKAQEIQERAHLARLGGEANARAKYAKTLLLNSWHEDGHEWVDRLEENHLNTDFNPSIVCPMAINDGVKPIAQAQPDSCMGYVRACHSTVQNSKPFNETLESYIDARLPLTKDILFPFCTAQWKRDQAHSVAIAQGARDGAVVINHMRTLFPSASAFDDTDAYIVQTSHISVTFDGESVLFFVHWFDSATERYHMERFFGGTVDVIAQCVQIRCVLRNLQDWAVGPRLEHIRRELKRLCEKEIAAADDSGKATGASSKRKKQG